MTQYYKTKLAAQYILNCYNYILYTIILYKTCKLILYIIQNFCNLSIIDGFIDPFKGSLNLST